MALEIHPFDDARFMLPACRRDALPIGQVANLFYGNGRPMQRVLDQDYRPLAVSDTRSDGLSTGFAFDPAGNLSALTAAGNTAPVVTLDYAPWAD